MKRFGFTLIVAGIAAVATFTFKSLAQNMVVDETYSVSRMESFENKRKFSFRMIPFDKQVSDVETAIITLGNYTDTESGDILTEIGNRNCVVSIDQPNVFKSKSGATFYVMCDDNWKSLKGTYKSVVRAISANYGKPGSKTETFASPSAPRNNDERMQLLREGKCDMCSEYYLDGNKLSVRAQYLPDYGCCTVVRFDENPAAVQGDFEKCTAAEYLTDRNIRVGVSVSEQRDESGLFYKVYLLVENNGDSDIQFDADAIKAELLTESGTTAELNAVAHSDYIAMLDRRREAERNEFSHLSAYNSVQKDFGYKVTPDMLYKELGKARRNFRIAARKNRLNRDAYLKTGTVAAHDYVYGFVQLPAESAGISLELKITVDGKTFPFCRKVAADVVAASTIEP